jgi:UMF1 family MFS transporter
MRRLSKEVWGWALYDWANSAFAVSVLAVVFQLYFIDVLATSGADTTGGRVNEVRLIGMTIPSGSLWAWSVALSMILVVIIAPVIGAVADYAGRKKRFLLFFCYTGATATMLMVFLGVGMWQLGMLLFVVSNVCFVSGNVVYNGLLTDVAMKDDEISFLSGFGWGLGYAASFLMLLINMVLIQMEIPSKVWSVRVALLIVGAWWALFAIPTFLWVKEKTKPRPLPAGKNLLTVGFSQLAQTVRGLPRHSQLLVFMAAFFLYNDGIQTIISQAATFSRLALNATLNAIIPAFLMIQITAFVGSLLFIRIERKVGTKPALLSALSAWIVIIAWAMVMQSVAEFYVMAFIGGLVLGISQSASRTLYVLMIPRTQSAEFFSLYAIVGKVASLVGPILFGFGVLYSSKIEHIPIVNSMAGAIFPLLLMVVIGTILLMKVDVENVRTQVAIDDTEPRPQPGEPS